MLTRGWVSFLRGGKRPKLFFFVKKGKDPKVASSYRPICLLPVLSKVLEKLIKVRIMYDLDRVGFLHDMQFGFREGRSTELANLVALDHVKEAKGRGDYPALVSLDIKELLTRLVGTRLRK